MKGLLIKDFYSIVGMKNAILVLVFACGFSIVINFESFAAAYIPMMGMMLVISSFSYDEYNKWDSYALTMPVNRKQIVLSKYCFVLFFLVVSTILALITSLAGMMVHQTGTLQDILYSSMVAPIFILIIICLLLPLLYKYGAEKARYALMFICLGIFGLGMFILPNFDLSGLLKLIDNLGTTGLALSVFAIGLITFVGSYFVSVAIYLKKEF